MIRSFKESKQLQTTRVQKGGKAHQSPGVQREITKGGQIGCHRSARPSPVLLLLLFASSQNFFTRTSTVRVKHDPIYCYVIRQYQVSLSFFFYLFFPPFFCCVSSSSQTAVFPVARGCRYIMIIILGKQRGERKENYGYYNHCVSSLILAESRYCQLYIRAIIRH